MAPLSVLTVALALPFSLVVAAPAAAAAVTVNDWSELTTAFAVNGDTVVLGSDIIAPGAAHLAVDAGESVTLDLNGHTLSITDPAANDAAVSVPATSSLTIIATGGGTLNAAGGWYAAGIGGDYLEDGGTVTITGGTINATGNDGGAGIGAGFEGDGGTVTITGGTINATGSTGGAGIGGGEYGNDGGTTTIDGGTITATGGLFAAGIGGGRWGNGGTVTINGGTITATGGQDGAGIGGGNNGTAGTLEIHGNPWVGAATSGIDGSSGGPGSTISNPTTPAGVGYSADGSIVGGGGRIEISFFTFHLISFDSADGTAIPDQPVTDGDTLTPPADPTRAGYQFTGWQLGTLAYDFSTPVTGPVTLTAAWLPTLAATGADPGPVLGIVLALLLLGGGLLTTARIRRA